MDWKIISIIIVVLALGIFVYNPLEPTSPRADDTGSTPEGISSVVNANNQFSLELYSNLKDKEEGNILSNLIKFSGIPLS